MSETEPKRTSGVHMIRWRQGRRPDVSVASCLGCAWVYAGERESARQAVVRHAEHEKGAP